MKGLGKFSIGLGIFEWIFFMVAFMAMGAFSFILFFFATGCAAVFIGLGVSVIHKANEAEAAERRFRELEDEHSRYTATHSSPMSSTRPSESISHQEKNDDDDWFKD